MANDKTRRLATNKLPKRQTAVVGPRRVVKIGRNELCPCGSGEKYKDCHAGEGEVFLQKLAVDKERERLREKRAQMKADGVPWYRRIFS